MTARAFDIAVVGGGLVGAALAFGLREIGARLALLDEGDVAHRAARGNFGLIWVQGKGLGMPRYAAWTQRSAREWPRLAALLREETGIDVALRQQGGLHVCLSPEELAARARRMTQWAAQEGNDAGIDVLDRAGVAAIEQAAREGCTGPNQMKAYTRCGMGPCQGRFCGLSVTEIIARSQSRAPADVGFLRSRFPAKPVALADVAAGSTTPEALRAVVRTQDP